MSTRKTKHIYIKNVILERDITSGQMEVKVITNHGRFIVAVNPIVVDAFYDHVAQRAREDIEKILAQEVHDKNSEEGSNG